ncbi:hypothetical protein RND71_040278 [Anisodus tanguticus]|uniref:Metalloenzyme domain-containing protein n=1 Tax=Anisodus tanguticus TaxID=243964 RepID=A0AAE1UT56_9SOLA|nr:hypothetical protein RND71_040278 [Anisodus tanguticus]
MVNLEQPKRRVAFVLIDGVGDVSLPRFGYKTPLQLSKIPNLDAIASAGVNGLMDPVEVGLGCGSDTAHLSLLGYEPRVYYRGRVHLSQLVPHWQCHREILHLRRADRHFEEEGPILCAALDGLKLHSFPEYEIRVRYATEHRCGVVVKGPKLSGNISGTDPLKDNRLLLQAKPLDDTDEAKHTAAVVNELSKEISRILLAHPLNAKRAAEGKNVANLVLLRGCGIRIEVAPFEKIHGLWPCMVAPTKIIAGLGLSLGIDILEAPGATGDYRTLLTSKATAIAKALSAPLQSCPNVFVPGEDEHKPGRFDGYDFEFLHIKLMGVKLNSSNEMMHVLIEYGGSCQAIDDACHDKASVFKVKGLEAVDCAIGQLARLLWEAESTGKFSYYLCVTGDHSTPVEYGDHSFEPVFPFPFVQAGEDLDPGTRIEEDKNKKLQFFAGDSVDKFSEIAAARDSLDRIPGSEMMGIIKAYLKLEA